MKIEELEIDNYKCLNNKGMPLKFTDLNILIGENDSGKTSLLEVIEIIFKQKDIKKTMFYDLKKDLLIKVKFKSFPESLLSENIKFQKINFSFNEYIKAANMGGSSYLAYEDIVKKKNSLFPDEYLEFVKEYSFYNELKTFYKMFINSAKITGKILIKADVPQGEEELAYIRDIDVVSVSYFDFDSHLKDIVDGLIKNKDFLSFMTSNLEAFDDFCMLAFNDFFESDQPPRFIDDQANMWDSLYSFTGSDDENLVWALDKNSLYFKFLKKLTSQKLFIDDSKEMILAKIAILLSSIIHNRNSQAPWECNASLQIGEYWINDFDTYSLKFYDMPLKLTDEVNIYESKNILDNYFLKDERFYEENKQFLPTLKVFRSEVINEEIPIKLFNDIYGGTYKLNDYIKERFLNYIKELNEKFNIEYFDKTKLQERSNRITKTMKELGEDLGEIDIDIKIENENLDSLDFGRKHPDKIKFEELFSPNINFILKKGGQEINLTQKSQGFLRKLLITDFLMLLDKDAKPDDIVNEYRKMITIQIGDSPKEEDIIKREAIKRNLTVNNMIILIEEPELHLHYNAQKTIMKLIKENITNSENQVFVTTHSHFVIENSGYENIYVFRKNMGSNISEIDNILNFNKDVEVLDKLQISLGLKKTDLLFLKKLIVIVEGKNDAAFIKGICRKPEYGINPEEILFINAEGQANINYYIGLGDFLKIKVIVIFDNHPKNIETKNRILTNPYKSEELTESIMKLVVLDKPDILNYLDIRIVENYFNLPKNSVNLNNNNLKDVLFAKGKHITTEDVEFLASQISKVDNELENKIINMIKLFQIY